MIQKHPDEMKDVMSKIGHTWEQHGVRSGAKTKAALNSPGFNEEQDKAFSSSESSLSEPNSRGLPVPPPILPHQQNWSSAAQNVRG